MERVASPQIQCDMELAQRHLDLLHRRLDQSLRGGGHGVLEPVHVDVVRVGVQHVAPGLVAERLAVTHRTQPEDTAQIRGLDL